MFGNPSRKSPENSSLYQLVKRLKIHIRNIIDFRTEPHLIELEDCRAAGCARTVRYRSAPCTRNGAQGLYVLDLLVREGQSAGFGGYFRFGYGHPTPYWARLGKVAGSGVGLLPLPSHEESEAEIRPRHERKSAFWAHVNGTRRDRHDEEDDLTP